MGLGWWGRGGEGRGAGGSRHEGKEAFKWHRVRRVGGKGKKGGGGGGGEKGGGTGLEGKMAGQWHGGIVWKGVRILQAAAKLERPGGCLGLRGGKEEWPWVCRGQKRVQ